MKLGDSLGRNRKRRGKARSAPDEVLPTSDTPLAASDEAPSTLDEVLSAPDEVPSTLDAVPSTLDEVPPTLDEAPSASDELPSAWDEVAQASVGAADEVSTRAVAEPEGWRPWRSKRPASGSGPDAPASGTRLPWSSGRNLLAATAAFLALGWFIGYMVATQVFFPAPPPPGDLFEVPNLRGLGLASAEERLAGAGLDLGPVDSLQHPTVAAGLILGQSPLPGQVASPETEIRVTMSAGPQARAVPDVRRLDEERARIVLETSGFVVDVVTTQSDEPRGQVVSVSPRPDSIVALPAEVRLVVSAGPPVVAMPLVLGLAQAEAEQLLDSAGLVVSDVEEVFRFGRDQGIVVEQEPAADTELRRGSSVRLKVGRRGGMGNNGPGRP